MADRYLILNDDDELVFEDFDEFDEPIDCDVIDIFEDKVVTYEHRDLYKSSDSENVTSHDEEDDEEDDVEYVVDGVKYYTKLSAESAEREIRENEARERRYWDWVLWG